MSEWNKLPGSQVLKQSTTNNGNVNAYIRAEIIVNWVDKDDSQSVHWKKPVSGTDYIIDFVPGEATGDTPVTWIKGSDGFYYWPNPVEPDKYTGILIDSCDAVEANQPTDCILSVSILSQAIQADGTFVKNGVTKTPVQDAWSSGVAGVSADGTLSIKTNQ